MSDEIIPLSPLAQSVKLGLYKHFRGGEYRLLSVGRHVKDPAQEFAVYQSKKTGYVWLRPLPMFFEEVERDAYKGPRFRYLPE